MPIVAYRNSLIIVQVKIAAGQTQSETVDCEVTNEGEACPRRLIIPTAGWTVGDLTFFAIDALPDTTTQTSSISISDGVSRAPYTLFSQPAGDTPDLLPYAFDSISKLFIVCSNPQVSDVLIGVCLKPIYQSTA